MRWVLAATAAQLVAAVVFGGLVYRLVVHALAPLLQVLGG